MSFMDGPLEREADALNELLRPPPQAFPKEEGAIGPLSLSLHLSFVRRNYMETGRPYRREPRLRELAPETM